MPNWSLRVATTLYIAAISVPSYAAIYNIEISGTIDSVSEHVNGASVGDTWSLSASFDESYTSQVPVHSPDVDNYSLNFPYPPSGYITASGGAAQLTMPYFLVADNVSGDYTYDGIYF